LPDTPLISFIAIDICRFLFFQPVYFVSAYAFRHRRFLSRLSASLFKADAIIYASIDYAFASFCRHYFQTCFFRLFHFFVFHFDIFIASCHTLAEERHDAYVIDSISLHFLRRFSLVFRYYGFYSSSSPADWLSGCFFIISFSEMPLASCLYAILLHY